MSGPAAGAIDQDAAKKLKDHQLCDERLEKTLQTSTLMIFSVGYPLL